MSELVVGSIAGLASNSFEVGIASGSTLDLANAKAGSLPDTALSAVPGMKLVNTYTFSGASTHTFGTTANPVFTSDYRNYKIVVSEMRVTGASALGNFQIRLASDGTPDTSANYQYQALTVNGTTVSGARTSGVTLWDIAAIGYASADYTTMEMLITAPAEAITTHFVSNSAWVRTGTGVEIATRSGYHYLSAQYDGFTILSNQTIAGRVSIYGLEEA